MQLTSKEGRGQVVLRATVFGWNEQNYILHVLGEVLNAVSIFSEMPKDYKQEQLVALRNIPESDSQHLRFELFGISRCYRRFGRSCGTHLSRVRQSEKNVGNTSVRI